MPTRMPLSVNSLAQLALMPGPPPTMTATPRDASVPRLSDRVMPRLPPVAFHALLASLSDFHHGRSENARRSISCVHVERCCVDASVQPYHFTDGSFDGVIAGHVERQHPERALARLGCR